MQQKNASYKYNLSKEEYECFEINGEEYRVRMFDAFTGISVAKIAWKNLLGNNIHEDAPLEEIFNAMALQVLSSEELEVLVRNSMKVCEKHLKAGWTSIVDKSGHYQIPEIETDLAATYIITRHAVIFGTSAFFIALSSGLK